MSGASGGGVSGGAGGGGGGGGGPPAPRPLEGARVLLGVTGSVAAVKCGEIARALRGGGAEVKVVATAAAAHFLDRAEASGYSGLPQEVEVLGDVQEWEAWSAVGDPVLHIELRKWADVLCLAPLSANSLAKLAGGFCDGLLTCTFRAWDWKSGRAVVAAPAMNTLMWQSPLTAPQIDTLRRLGVRVVEPVAKVLACGDEGVGAMAAPDTIVHAVTSALADRRGAPGASTQAEPKVQAPT